MFKVQLLANIVCNSHSWSSDFRGVSAARATCEKAWGQNLVGLSTNIAWNRLNIRKFSKKILNITTFSQISRKTLYITRIFCKKQNPLQTLFVSRKIESSESLRPIFLCSSRSWRGLGYAVLGNSCNDQLVT